MSAAFESASTRAAFYLAFGAAASVLFSIAVSNILLALALAALLISGARMRFPPVLLPLGFFAAGTILSLALSESPWEGRPQIRKFYVFLLLLVLSSTFLHLRKVRWLVMAWAALGTLSAARALAQFGWMLKNCGESYGCYVGERITGFMSHWMTFGGHMMIVLLLVGAFLFWAEPPKRPLWLWIAGGGLMGSALFAGGTRSIWLAMAISGGYLLWRWKRWTLALVPVAVGLALLIAPSYLKQRFTSAWRPQGEVDSNLHRSVSWRTGMRMIQAHPFFGLGPEIPKLKFKEYVPADVVRLPEGWYGHLHNFYLHFAAERGIPTLLALLWFLGKMLADFVSALRRTPRGPGDARFVLEAAIATILAILIGGVFEHNLGDSEVLMLFLAIMSCGYTAVGSLRPAQVREHEPVAQGA